MDVVDTIGMGLINLKICFLKTSNESALLLYQSNLSQSAITEGKKEFLK